MLINFLLGLMRGYILFTITIYKKRRLMVDGFKQSIDSDKAFSVVNEDNELVGNCEFFDVGDEGEEIIAVSVQMKPTLTGNGHGINFVNAIIEQGRGLFKFNHLELIVVDFNIRAIKVYEKVGFRKIGEIENK